MILDRIATIDPKLLSYVTVTKEDALKSAAIAQGEIATGKRKSLLHGIPIAIKDIYDTAGVRLPFITRHPCARSLKCSATKPGFCWRRRR
jgi:Asp-tRNA(Asn)/Glu-tRNA(Gln) amidotransferase A subunit family amidase